MIFFGHLGLGDALAAPVRRGLPRRWVLLGTVLPDLLDKPLY
ncbi:MAG: metal-dependent hydrolase, partial [Elusimicrobia bacterium]|nr:metal-dependent hydrolase [Elusimicrobiota bacterium]